MVLGVGLKEAERIIIGSYQLWQMDRDKAQFSLLEHKHSGIYTHSQCVNEVIIICIHSSYIKWRNTVWHNIHGKVHQCTSAINEIDLIYTVYVRIEAQASILFRSLWSSLYSSQAFIWAQLLLNSCIRFKYFIHKSYLGNLYKWLPLTSVRTLISLPLAVASVQTLPSPSRYLNPPAYIISNLFGFKEPRDVVRRYLDPATIYKWLSWTLVSKRTYTVRIYTSQSDS